MRGLRLTAMDILAIALGIVMFVALYVFIEGIDRI